MELRFTGSYWIASFEAMASPCEVMMYCKDAREARTMASLAVSEAQRIEQKFSRYSNSNVVHEINHSDGETVSVDDETSRLLDYANQCHGLSEGAFDITSGVLRKVWTFDGGDRLPRKEDVEALLSCIGWDKVRWVSPQLRMQPGMEIDLGGIGKEYAVDKVAEMLFEVSSKPVLLNFGGDIRAIGKNADDESWMVGIEDPDADREAIGQIEIKNGGIATSGDSQRCVFRNGIRYSHILDPRTGWPVPDGPRSVTVLGNNCSESGFLATMAMLRGINAEAFLDSVGLAYRCMWQ